MNKIYKTRLETGFVYMLSTGNKKCVPMVHKLAPTVGCPNAQCPLARRYAPIQNPKSKIPNFDAPRPNPQS
jgi:hypothetical protein